MSTQNNNIFLSEFIDELYVECDERLSAIRQDLLSLEFFVGQLIIDNSLIDGILRHCHTIKGLVGTINLTSAEQLAHQIESYLRSLRRQEIALTLVGIEKLITAINLLDQIITASRRQTELPDVEATIQTLQVGIQPSPPPVGTPDYQPPGKESEVAKFKTYLFSFIPTAVLAEQGVNVNSIRANLRQIGQIIQAKPFTTGEGQLGFKFIVATPVDESQFAHWQGLTYQLQPVEPQLPSEGEALQDIPSPQPTTTTDNARTLPTLAPTNKVRVDLGRLDELMWVVGELITTRGRQEENLKRLQRHLPLIEWRALQETQQAFERQLRELREGIMRVRLVPIGQVFERMRFVVRDLARETQKQVHLILNHQEIEVDKLVADKMSDPLLHLVRNAVSHGLESPEERLTKGKTPEGTIHLKASAAGDAVIIEIQDDGRGIDKALVTAQAYQQGLLTADSTIDDNELLELLCKPGFSTHQQADLTSGRGIGMDVVKNAVLELGGHINLVTQKDLGTCFIIQLPLTLAIADALIIAVGGHRFAIPQLAVREVITLEQADITAAQEREMIYHRDKVLPLIRLAHYFNLTETDQTTVTVLIVGSANEIGIIVEQVIRRREIVVRALNDSFVRVPGIAGATELGDGKVILVVDVNAVTKNYTA